MGGMCDEPITAADYNGFMKLGMEHLEKAHPEMAASIKAAPKDDPMMAQWDKDFRKTLEETPENK